MFMLVSVEKKSMVAVNLIKQILKTITKHMICIMLIVKVIVTI